MNLREKLCTYEKETPPEVRPPMPYYLHQADELMFIRRKLGMVSCHHMTEECDRLIALMQDGAKTGARDVTLTQ
jgi:hypothetical protein